VHRLLRTITLLEEGAARLTAAVHPLVADHILVGILLRAAIAAAEGHDPSLKPLRLT